MTRDDLSAVLPSDLWLTRLSLTGEELRAVLEHVVAGKDLIAHIAGLEVWYDPGRDEGRRIRRVRLPDGRDLRDNQTYTLAASVSLFEGTAGFSIVQWLPREDAAVSDVDAIADYLQLLKQPVEAPSANRFHISR